MSDNMFHRIVDELVAEGVPWERAIEQAAEQAANYVDPFERMRRAALDKQARTA